MLTITKLSWGAEDKDRLLEVRIENNNELIRAALAAVICLQQPQLFILDEV